MERLSGWLLAGILMIAVGSFVPEAAAASDGWVEKGGQHYYYVDNEPVKGWYLTGGAWYYFDLESGARLTGWLEENGTWFYLKSNGAMHTGWLSYGGKWYFLQKNGAMKTGWLYVSSKWYYLMDDGSMKTGWLRENNSWYFLKSDGAMQAGWLDQAGKRYFLENNGAMKTGWLLYLNKWYYFNGTGAMQKGWLKESGEWYYLDSNGVMKTGWLLYNNQWYYLNRSGKMETGWVWFGQEWNYFTKNGIWVKNTVVDEMETIWEHDQLILVTAANYDSNKAKIRTFEKVDGKWYERLNVSGYLGKYGFADVMREGGKESPRGKYSIGTAFGRFVNPGTKLPYRKITSDDVWVDDSASPLYNTWQKASANNGQWNSAEKMDIPLYNYGFVINYNTEKRVPGAGSAIFFHVGDNYTLGCTATPQNYVLSILRWLDPAKNPVIIQAPEGELGEY
ncbi:cell wall-binding protein [Mesobacillus boroniphilus]|nr:cell wall-binding protein [Mesobacillus boroniphilus]